MSVPTPLQVVSFQGPMLRTPELDVLGNDDLFHRPWALIGRLKGKTNGRSCCSGFGGFPFYAGALSLGPRGTPSPDLGEVAGVQSCTVQLAGHC